MKSKNMPDKICPVCNLKFSWRKKWLKNWEEVKYCSVKCRNNKNGNYLSKNKSKTKANDS